ncbi:MAG: long-chain fatty acid--CoA ligase [Acetobacteraceae bacterium]|nr:long-chain fatty acid--CoA ligase [Acetobacteraceae bacterium]MSP30041.1 long-chain fatty acid--CoA ligase [Acetobacteraceae bacterium]
MQKYPRWPNLATMMFDRAKSWPDRPMLRAWRGGAWQSMSWGVFARQAASVARGLRAAGVKAGDRVLIVAENRPEYPIAETALLAIQAVPVPAYTTNTVTDHAHVLRDAGVRAAIVSSAALAGRVRAAAEQTGGLDVLVTMEDIPGATAWGSLIADDRPADDIVAEAEKIDGETLACLIYTSGTGGAAKGVMLPHRAILSNCRGAFELLRPLGLGNEIYLSFLPLSHSYEHTCGQFFLLSLGAEVVYARGLEHLAADLAAVRPTIITVVPRILEVFCDRARAQMAREKPLRQWLFGVALECGLRRVDGAQRWFDPLLHPLLDRLVGNKIRARFGGHLKALVSGGARLDPDVGKFFLAFGLKIIQGYGQTEAGPVISANPPEAIRVETVGHVLEGVDLRIADDGEILVRGDLVMQGYWGQPAATAAVIRDGWLHTGDIGAIDTDRYLRITDRKKDIIVLSGGDNVSPARVEGMLTGEGEIAQAVVAGEGQAGVCALLVPAEGAGMAGVAAAVARVNARLSVIERVRKHALVEPFTVENGLLTATHKIRRGLVIKAYAELLARLHV